MKLFQGRSPVFAVGFSFAKYRKLIVTVEWHLYGAGWYKWSYHGILLLKISQKYGEILLKYSKHISEFQMKHMVSAQTCNI